MIINIFRFIKKEISYFHILINFKLLFEIISACGGNVNTLDTLAGVAEKRHNIEKTKREKLKPYFDVTTINCISLHKKIGKKEYKEFNKAIEKLDVLWVIPFLR